MLKFRSILVISSLCAIAMLSACGIDPVGTYSTDKVPIEASTKVTKSASTEAPQSQPTVYLVTFEVRQNHFTLDLGKHISDAANKTTFQVPVDKQFYDTVSVGTVINDDFRVGSLIMRGSVGNWKITVKEKETA